MPRRDRLWVPGGIYHLTVRGNNRQRIFCADLDFEEYLRVLRERCVTQPCDLMAYCLMSNHVHLLLRSAIHSNLSGLMHDLNVSYTRYFNGRYGHVGQLYQGRFYSNLVDRDDYLLEVTRYIHLNPVRAQLVRRAADYPWSSYRRYAGVERSTRLSVACEPVWALFGEPSDEQPERYRRFVDDLVAEEHEAWVRKLERRRLIPPRRWLRPLL